jgi:hypothetical protein
MRNSSIAPCGHIIQMVQLMMEMSTATRDQPQEGQRGKKATVLDSWRTIQAATKQIDSNFS